MNKSGTFLPAIALSVALSSFCLQAADTAPVSPGIKLPVKVDFPGDGFSSMGVYDEKGTLVRTLSYAQPVKKGKETLNWDGTTDLGLPAEPGKYQARGVWFPHQPKIDYIMKVGVSGNPPYLTDSDTSSWGGNLGGPADVCTNGKNILTIFACVESPRLTGIQIMDMEGNVLRHFNSFFPWDIRMACAMDDKNFYVAVAALNEKRLVIGKYDIENGQSREILGDVPVGNHMDKGGAYGVRWTVDIRGIAVANGKIYIPANLDNKVFIMDASNGKILKTVDVPSPRDIVMQQDGKGFLLSGKKLVRIDADGNIGGEVISEGLDDPYGVAVDAAGNLYVSDDGAAQQVKVFSSEGKLIRKIGKDGGNPPSGKYDPAGMTQPAGICVAPNGNVWLTTADIFQQLSVWNPQGERVKTFYNAPMLSGQGRLSPSRDEMIVGNDNFGGQAGAYAYQIDLKSGTWSPSWSRPMPIDQSHQDDVFLGNGHIYGALAEMYNNHAPYLGWSEGSVKGLNGKNYLHGGDLSLYLFDEKNKEPKLAAFVYTHNAEKLPDGRYQGDYDRGNMQNMFSWADLNGDGKMSLDEVTYAENVEVLKDEEVHRMLSWQINPDLSIYFLGGHAIYLLKPKEILPSGVPVYDWSKLEKVSDLKVPDFKGGEEGDYKAVAYTMLNYLSVVDGSAYVLATPNSKNPIKMTGVDGDGWWGSRNWRMTPLRFNLKTGEPSWVKLGRRAAGVAKPGEMYYPGWGLAGSVDGVDFYADTLSQVWAWTNDGLFLGPMYNDGSSGIFDANSLFIELTGAYVYKINGKTYLFGGDHGVSVHEVKVPPLTPIQGGSLTMTPELAAQVRRWDPDGPAPGKRPIYSARAIYNFTDQVNAPTRTITVDGKLDPAEWQGIEPMEIKLDGKTVATVKVTFDKEKLYLAYDVQDVNGLKNDGHELPYAPFVSGSYVDFNLAPQWGNPDRTEPIEGDVRIIMARINGPNPSDYQMGFWAVKKKMDEYAVRREDAKPNKPQTIESPAQKRTFDDIDPVRGLVFAYQTTSTGYTLEAAVPLTEVGIRPAWMPAIGFDASVGFSDPSGKLRTRAVHWGGQSEGVVVDRPGSTELKPATWGTMQLDRNPVPAASN